MNNKKMALCMAVVMLSTAFTGCGSKKAETDGEVAVITWESTNTNQKAVMTKMVEEFNNTVGKDNKMKIDYKVTNASDSSAGEVAYQTGQEPDVGGGVGLAQGVEKDYLLAFEDIPGTEEILKKYEGALVEGWHTYKGKTYTVPYAAVTAGLFYNKDMFKKAGIVDENGNPKGPETYAELRDYAKKLTDESKRQYGIIMDMKWGGFTGYIMNYLTQTNCGHWGYDFENDVWDCSVYKPVLEALMALRDDGSIYPGAEGIERDAARARFADGNIGMFFGLSYDVGEFEYNFPLSFELGVVPLPTADKNIRYYQPSHPQWTPQVSKRILTHATNEQVLALLQFMTSDEFMIELYKGGAALPWKYDVIKDVNDDEVKDIACWADMGKMLEISIPYRDPAAADLGGKDVNYMPRIWNNGEDIDKVLSEITKIRNDGVKLYREEHPEYDINRSIIPNYNKLRDNK